MSREKTRKENLSSASPDIPHDAFATCTVPRESQVIVMNGLHVRPVPRAGQTVGQIRDELEEQMNIDPESMATIDGEAADVDTVLREGQVLLFVKHAGEKGAGPKMR